MKKIFMLIGVVILAAVVFASCGVKGGTIEVTNDVPKVAGVGVPITIYVGKAALTTNVSKGTTIESGKTETWTFDEDGDYLVSTVPIVLGVSVGAKTVKLSGGNTETVSITSVF